MVQSDHQITKGSGCRTATTICFGTTVMKSGPIKLRAFMVRQRLFHVKAAGTKDWVDHKDTGMFLISFRLPRQVFQ